MSVLQELGIESMISSDLKLVSLTWAPDKNQLFLHLSDLKPKGRRVSGWGNSIKEATLNALARETLLATSVKTTRSFENLRPQSNRGLKNITLEDL